MKLHPFDVLYGNVSKTSPGLGGKPTVGASWVPPGCLDGSKWQSVFSWTSWIRIVKTRSKSTCLWKAHIKRINIRSFSTWRFGLRSHGRLTFSKRIVFAKCQKHKNHNFGNEWDRNSRFWTFEKGNRRRIARSSDLDYSRPQKYVFWIIFFGFTIFLGLGVESICNTYVIPM